MSLFLLMRQKKLLNYKILYSKTSIKYLQGLEQKLAKKIVEAIDKLPSEGDIKRLKGKKVMNVFRLRCGKHRILYEMEEEILKILKIDTRGDAYK